MLYVRFTVENRIRSTLVFLHLFYYEVYVVDIHTKYPKTCVDKYSNLS